jgi:hypothetical protein
MRKFAWVLVFAVVMVLTGAAHAHAVPLTVTRGSVLSIDGFINDSFFDFGGDGFSASGSAPGISSDGGSYGIAFTNPFEVIVGDLVCVPPRQDCGSMTLTHPRLGPPPDDVPFFESSARFTATGFISVDDKSFDFVGHGGVTATWCVGNTLCDNGSPIMSYEFTVSVPEPPTLLLVVASFGMLGALFGARVLRDRLRSPDT